MRAATPVKYHALKKRSKKSLVLPKIVLLSVVLTAALLFCFSDFLPGSVRSFPFSCTVGSNDRTVEERGSCPLPESQVCALDPITQGKPLEVLDMTSEGDSLFSLLSMNLCDDAVAKKAAQSLASTIQRELGKRFSSGDELKAGRRYVIYVDANRVFRKATFELDPARVFHCVKEGDRIRSWKEDVVLDYKTEVLCLDVRRGIVESILAAREGRELALKLIHVFRWDIDFHSDVRNGDRCKIVFERRYADDRPNGYGRILFAVYEGTRSGRKTACLFNGEYYNENGVELKKNYLRAPLNTLRITSGFGYRIHPVLGYRKMHTGVDYGAPTGTPVFAIANGTVIFEGCGEAYGLYVCVRHDNGYESRYSHLSRILVKKGQKVQQRQTIGLIGSTGRSTGPHLFFEIIVNGKHIDPTKVKMITSPRTVPTPLHDRFKAIVNVRARFLTREVSGPAHTS